MKKILLCSFAGLLFLMILMGHWTCKQTIQPVSLTKDERMAWWREAKFDIMSTPFHRDILKELSIACKTVLPPVRSAHCPGEGVR